MATSAAFMMFNTVVRPSPSVLATCRLVIPLA